MSKRKWYAKAVYLLVALAMTVGLLMGPAVAADGPELVITVDPPDGSSIFCGDNETLTVTVSNTGAYAEDVVLTAAVPPGAPGMVAPGNVTLYDICTDCSKEATLSLNCTGKGTVTVNLTATAANDGAPAVLQVSYEQICRFDVDITAPQDGDTVDVSDTFGVAANITNNTDEYCHALNVTLNITGEAVQVGGNATYTINLHAGETEEVNWTVHCTAEGEATFNVTATGCDQSGDCAELCADTVKILQTPPGDCTPNCNFTYEILPIEFGCEGDRIDEDVCFCDEFDVKVAVNNTGGDCSGNISGIVEMHAIAGDAEPVADGSGLDPDQRGFGPIAVGGSQILTFTWHCYDAGDNCNATLPLDLFQSGVDFEARAWGYCEPPDQADVYMPTTPPSQGWGHYWGTPATYTDYINQTWIDLKLFDDWENGDPVCTCRDYCFGDDILVYPRVENCGNVTLKNAEVFFLDMRGNITWEGTPKDSIFIGDIPAGQIGTTDEAFHFKCNATGEAWLSFKAAGVYLPARTVCDVDDVNIHQKEAPELEVELTAEDCQQYCDNFWVKAVITNNGTAEATAIEITNIVLTPSGNVTPVTVMTCAGCDMLYPGENCTCGQQFHCNGPDNADFSVDVTGVATCGAILMASDCVSVEQIMLDIDIITPEECDTKCVTDTFCVTANITDNDGDTCFAGLNATISFPNGKADIEVGENATKAFNLTDGDTQQVSWSVHCYEAGDTDIQVEVTGCSSASQNSTNSTACPCVGCPPCDCCELHDKYDTITIYQIGRPDLDMEITSPDNLDTLVATSQDFAVTVTIRNDTDLSDVTVTDIGLAYHPESGATIVQAPEVPFVIPEGETTKVTWTLHCEEPGLLTFMAYATSENEIGCVEEDWTFPLLLWQYPAASLEVDIIRVEPATNITVCENFTVVYEVNNTGAADATDVVAKLSVTPEGSARPVEGIGSGYTQRIGTIPAGGGTGELVWNLHCKEACESNIVITAEGNDEYGWHKKQECQSTGEFIIEAGCFGIDETYSDGNTTAKGVKYGILFGESSGLIGPFNLNTPVSAISDFGDYSGNLVAMGAVIPNLPPSHYEALLDWLCGMGIDNANPGGGPPSCLLDLLEYIGMQGVDKDVMVFVGHLDMEAPGLTESCYEVWGGLIQIINGHTSGVELTFGSGPVWWMTMEDGEYCSTMATEALRPINPDFIESDTVTVKQLEPAQLVVEIDFPYEGFRTDATEEYDVTATISNIGEETAENVSVTLSVDDSAQILSLDPAMQDIAGGDSVSVTWEVTCTEAGFSVFSANATGTGAISGNAVEAFDTVTVKQGEVPLAQLVVQIEYPENGDEFIEGDQFPVTAHVKNVGERTAKDVEVSIDISANAENVSGPSGTWPKNISPTSEAVATWMVNCTAPGFSVITVEASGNSTENACNTAVETVTIKQLPAPEPYLTVDVSAPAEVMEGSTYIVTAVVTNEGEADATGVNATIQIAGDAELSADQTGLVHITDATIEVGDQAKAEWRVECTGGEDVNISVEARGTDTNLAIDSVAVKQIPISPYLTVDVSAPAQVMEGSTYIVTAVVTNEGQEEAMDVNADIQITGDAELSADQSGLAHIINADIAGGDQAKAEWRVECTGGEDVNISVEASGDNTNLAIGSVAVMQIALAAPFLTVDITYPNNGDMFYGGEDPESFELTAVVTNVGELDYTGDIDVDLEAFGPIIPTTNNTTITGGIVAGESEVVTFTMTAGMTTGSAVIMVTGTGPNTALDVVTVKIDPEPVQVLFEGANPIVYEGKTMSLPEALTNISDYLEIMWQRDLSTGEWHVFFFFQGQPLGDLTELVEDNPYVVVVTQDCTWRLPF